MSATDATTTAIAALIEDYASRGVFRASAESIDSAGRTSFRLMWFQNQEMTLAIDPRRREARLADVMPSVAPRSSLDRALRAWLRDRSNERLPAHRRIDPSEMQAKLTRRAGHMQLAIVSASGDMLAATSAVVHLANELYLGFLSAPEHYSWIVETFELDPDNPRWP